MLLLTITVIIALSTILLGLWFMNRKGRYLNMDQLQLFIAVAAGFILGALFLELLPGSIEKYPSGVRSFFIWAGLGMILVILFERYGVPRLKFVDRFFKPDTAALKNIQVHDESIHPTPITLRRPEGAAPLEALDPSSRAHAHHHHHNLEEAEACELSHEHGHLHSHTHLDFVGHGEVCSAIACFMICSFFDGVALSSIQAVDPKMGLVIVIGVVLHLLPEGVLSGALALAGGASVRAASKVLYFIGGSFVLGAIIPVVVTGFQSVFVAISCGVLIFVTLVQLVPTALKLKFAPIWMMLGAGLYLGTHGLLDWTGLHGHP